MNKTLIASLLFAIIALDVIAATLIIIFAPESFNTFVTFLGTVIALAISGTVTISQIDALKNKVEQVEKNTNGINSALLAAVTEKRSLTEFEIQQLKTEQLGRD